ncbi:MAG: SDR family NAD(P)-dependent oxidoreductase [Cyanobacteria bacterium SBLK]|nr:SDR family NAD(P)-dependent oxidoreductase [Cyanobacteria bacterium SBLK]
MTERDRQKVCIVTGGNSGVGLMTAVGLAKMNARVFIACRSPNKGAKAVDFIRKTTGNLQIECLPLDLASLDSVRRFVELFQTRNLPLDILVNNAGIFNNRGITKEGFELIWGTNYLGHFLLTYLLLENLKKSASGRIIMVASDLAKQPKSIHWDLVEKKTPMNFLQLYAISKLCLLLLVRELSEKCQDSSLSISAIHPGFVQSNITIWHRLSKYIGIGVSPEQGAYSALFCATSAHLEGISGKFFDRKAREIELPKLAQSQILSQELWERSLEWTGLNNGKSKIINNYDSEDEIFGSYSLALQQNEVDNLRKNISENVLPKAPHHILINSFFKSFIQLKFGSIFLLLMQLWKKEFYMERHLDSNAVLKLCQNEKLLEKVREHLGKNIVLWRSEIWMSYPSQQLIPLWHQDSYPKLLKGYGKSINAYVALTEVNELNGFQYISKKYQKEDNCCVTMSDPFSGNHFFKIDNDLEKKALSVVLHPGEFILFSDRLVHRSLRNTSGRVRLSLTLRFTQSCVRILPGYSPIYKPEIEMS